MMKVETSELDGKALLLVEGRLAGDLKNVTCVDRAGRSLLRSMHTSGVEFLRAGIALQDILDQIIEPHMPE